jgi:hypothetical protein
MFRKQEEYVKPVKGGIWKVVVFVFLVLFLWDGFKLLKSYMPSHNNSPAPVVATKPAAPARKQAGTGSPVQQGVGLAGQKAPNGTRADSVAKGEWTVHFHDDVLGNCVDYTISKKDPLFFMGLTVYRDKIFVKTWPARWSNLISFEVSGGPTLKIYDDHDPDCERIMDNSVFVICGDSAKAIIGALQQGTSLIIRDVLGKWELEPRGTFPLEGFKVAYEKAMEGKFDANER